LTQPTVFRKILVANRSEIALRLMRTAHAMGYRTVAVYSTVDRDAAHVHAADQAVCVGDALPAQSYLCIPALLAAARATGADAVHPGYGFLAESEEFACACSAAGLVFIGPSPRAIRVMGDKAEAKRLMGEAGVPCIPGYQGADQSDARLADEAERIGYPVMIKATAGGGGRGIRLVQSPGAFAALLRSAQSEAKHAFGDATVMLEQAILEPRHIEIQVFADRYGNAVHLGERDCSVQRRHQKLIEEAPSPAVDVGLRSRMGASAVAAVRAIGYEGAGTLEFLLDREGRYYFMEMNTRLQVEHPVTEAITGLDLVEWQLRVACGERLPRLQDELTIRGHALEARIYAEDAEREFLPATGRIVHLAAPAESAHVRIDTGVRAGDGISPFYDPMIAKLIVWDHDRDAALARMRTALDDYAIVGLTTNLAFLGRLVGSRAFAEADLDTGLIERNRETLFPAPAPVADRLLALAAAFVLLDIRDAADRRAAVSADAHSPWHAIDGWRMNQDHHHHLVFHDGDRQHAVTVDYHGEGYELELPHGRQPLACARRGEAIEAVLGDETVVGTVVRTGDTLHLFAHGERRALTLHDPLTQEVDGEAHGGSLAAPMPGKIIAILVEAGATVERGAPLIIMEAMKMEHTITAPAAGQVTELLFKVGEQVPEGADLIAFERNDAIVRV